MKKIKYKRHPKIRNERQVIINRQLWGTILHIRGAYFVRQFGHTNVHPFKLLREARQYIAHVTK